MCNLQGVAIDWHPFQLRQLNVLQAPHIDCCIRFAGVVNAECAQFGVRVTIQRIVTLRWPRFGYLTLTPTLNSEFSDPPNTCFPTGLGVRPPRGNAESFRLSRTGNQFAISLAGPATGCTGRSLSVGSACYTDNFHMTA